MRKQFLLIAGFWLAFFGASCQTESREEMIDEGYDLGNPEKLFMPDILLEVSGIHFFPGHYDSVWAVQDEKGMVFQLKLGDKKYREFRFAKDGDYEDLSFLDQNLYVLRSDGQLFHIPYQAADGLITDSTREWTDLLPEAEYEGLYGDSLTQSLYVLSKTPAGRKANSGASIQVLRINEDGRPEYDRQIKIANDSINARLGKKMKGGRLQASGLARHPITGDWYLISSVNKLLIVTDNNFSLKNLWPLSPSRFRQPEGIAFDAKGNLYISNEGDEVSSGNILKFDYHPTNSQP